MTVKEINCKAVELWQRFISILPNRTKWPLIYPTQLNTGGLVIVGCNPALPTSAKYYKIPAFNPDDQPWQLMQIADTLATHEAKARGDYPYFTACQALATELGFNSWEHVDLFFYRETSQSNTRRLVETKFEELNDFGNRQFNLSFELLKLTRPKIVLVANAFAARIFKKFHKLEFDNKEGVYWMKLETETVPVFLSSMLSGQRCLDLHSRERLVWHMKTTLAKIKQPSNEI